MKKHLRRPRRLLAVALTAAVAPLAFAASASATITGEFGNFAHCPVSNPATFACLFAQSTSGTFQISKTEVPLTKTITLQGGLPETTGEFSEIIPASGAETLSKTPQTVPGGLFKIVAPKFLPGFLQELFNEFINKGITGVTATTELVGTARLSPSNILSETGTSLELPARVHLENPFLGSGCYVGSASKPVVVDFTDGTSGSLKGKVGEASISPEGIIKIANNSLVNNTFAAPKAEGCGGIFSFLIDGAVDAELELPSASGNNTAILNGSQEIGPAEAAREHGV